MGAATSIIFVVTKVLSWQSQVCRDKTLVTTKLCMSWQNNFVTSKLLSWQIFVKTNMCLSWQQFCHDKHTFVMTKDMFVMTKVSLSRQNFCHDYKHTSVATKAVFCHNKNYICGSSHQWYFTAIMTLTHCSWQPCQPAVHKPEFLETCL